MVETDTRREQIYRAASGLFSRNGYRATSVRDIARELDIQGGSLYAHISSKEEVLWEIITRTADAFFLAARPIAASDRPATERLHLMILAHVGVVVSHLSHATVFFQDWRYLSEPRRVAVLAMRDEYEALFRQVVREGSDAGEFAARDPRLVTIALLTSLNGISSWFQPDGALHADAVAEGYAELFLNGLRGERETA